MILWTILAFALFASGYGIARLRDNRSEYNRGYLAGRSEERSHVNARMLRDRSRVFKDAAVIGRWAFSRN